MYAEGRGVAKDQEQAIGWLRKAAEHKNDKAIEYLKNMTNQSK
jgi:TPR repeat protein